MPSPKTYALALLAVATLGAAWLAWRQQAELAELRTAAMHRDERADLQKRLWELEKQNRELRDRLATQGDVREDAPPDGERPRGGPPGERGGRGDPRRDMMNQFTARERELRELMLKPEVQALWNQQQQAALDSRYASLFRNLNLPAEQIERLKSLLAERSTTVIDVLSAAREQGIDPRQSPEAFRMLVGDAQNAVNDSIKSLVGENGFAQLTQYEQTLPQRNTVNQLEQRLSYSSTPLTSVQAEQLVQILAQNAPPQTPGGNPAATFDHPAPGPDRGGPGPGGPGGGPGGGPPGRGPDFGMVMNVLGSGAAPTLTLLDGGRGNATAPITPAAVDQSQTVLSPPQVQALQQIQQQQQSQQQLRQIVNDTLGANQPPPPAGKAGPGGTSGQNPLPRKR